jgi:dTDP-4-dehydrorhamnose 3,5-epimerase
MNRFRINDCPLPGLKRIERQLLTDSRGFLARIFCAEELATVGWRWPVAQINHTCTAQAGTVRGLHFQRPPHAEMKLVTCIRGEVWDVAVDLRTQSPTYLRWHGEHLSATSALLIPAGFAHGFQALSDNIELLYCHSMAYHPVSEGGLNPLDPTLAIPWPLAVSRISSHDREHPLLDANGANFPGIVLE